MGYFWALGLRKKNHQTPKATKARPTTPPTTPPAIAPAFELLPLEVLELLESFELPLGELPSEVVVFVPVEFPG